MLVRNMQKWIDMTNTITLILSLGRFRFLIGGFFLYTMGALLAVAAGTPFSLVYFIIGYAIMLPAHLSLSYSNNYFDTEVDQYNTPISIAGGSKILLEHPELRPLCKYIAIGLLFLSIFIASIFVVIFSFPLTYFGFIIFGNLLGWFYTAPPLRLAYHGLGEIANMINMGFLMPGIGYWTMSGRLDLIFFMFAIAFLFYGLDFMIIVETPDMEGDKKAQKSTLVTRIGRKQSYIIILISLLLASLYFLGIELLGYFASFLDFLIIFILSLLPFIIAVFGWRFHPIQKQIATKIAQKNMGALISFILLLNIYFLIVILA